MKLEPMRWWHIDQVHELEQQLFPVDAWSKEQFWSELAQPTRRYVVAIEGGSVLGYYGLFALAPQSDVQTIAVSPEAQGRGLGAQLLNSLIEEALAQGCEQVMLEVRSDNAAALALYARFEFEALNVRADYYAHGVDAVVMRQKPLKMVVAS
ncbi:unannotated protein [freshwater metagenome]|uniref:Unannotated protein n=1 Tax=freshwater metagenome TaxID=449393 RepID=A0A6J7FW30_9ZZZZ|nr:ribosomal-protein-alanine N-acetyltransferase [Actinomycetota bacterium]MSZ41097.1 ribosomal-protein-alanine N-acetyltransferase [Actinomycetota bacterium]